MNETDKNYITEDDEYKIKHYVIGNLFPKISIQDSELLLNYIIKILYALFNIYFFDIPKYIIWRQLSSDNYSDLKSLVLLLLPHFDKTENRSQLESLTDLYTAKIKNVDINKESPKYKYNNVQFGRSIRSGNKKGEFVYNNDILDENFKFLLNTIIETSNKLYVNWINIVPYEYQKYNSSLYIETKKKWDKKVYDDFIIIEDYDKLDKYKKLKGIYVGDIYNTIANDIYNEIKKIKWLIYDVKTNKNDIMKFLDVFKKIFPHMFDDNDVVDLNNFNSSEYMIEHNYLKQYEYVWKHYFVNVDGLNYEDIQIIEKTHGQLLYSFLFFFEKYYDNIEEVIQNGYIPLNVLNTPTKDEDVDEDYKGEDIDINLIYNICDKLKSINFKYIYDFIKSSLNILNKTTYYSKNIDTSFKNTHDTNNIDAFDISITLKNLYNFAKSLTHNINTQTGDYFQLPNLWKMLKDEDKKMIVDRLNGKNISKWFNISGYIRRIYDINDKNKIQQYNITIHTKIRETMINVVYDTLVLKGLLSKFVVNEEMLDKVNFNDDKSKKLIINIIGDKMFNNNNSLWTNGYYFLTRTPYSDLKYNIDGITYDYTIENRKKMWYSFYALNWVSQISFYHHYINNRVIFVTGVTGSGKSTQVPKLILYSLKMIDYNNNGKIACTQPRIIPTRGNATRISNELGVPIEIEDKINNANIKTKNYNVQYSYQGEKHQPKTRWDGLSLLVCTDGLLLNQMNNFLLKTDKGKNIYDIIIVDEAHEHNANMDIILTRMKSITYYNNTIKLFIISATMDYDEPIYRRYYRDINDNLIYPYTSFFWRDNNEKHPGKKNYDRINVDRRIHVSPPDAKNPYKVDEYFVPDKSVEMLVNDIISNTPNGDILIFESGEYDVMKMTKLLNESSMNSNVIAIPVYGQMHKSLKENLGKINPSKIRIDRTNINYDELTFDYIRKGNNIYNRIIYIATNVAEASITIEGLKFVIDIGRHKINSYNFQTNSTYLEEVYITEMNRIQRKGRVGRTDTGIVYYLYDHEKTKQSIAYYNISSKNLIWDIDKLISNEEQEIIFEKTKDITMPGPMRCLDYNEKIFEMLRKTYMNQFYIGNKSFYDYENVDTPVIIGDNTLKYGYSYDDILDVYGKIYIIHPEEPYIKRNLFGEVIGCTPMADIHNVKISNSKINSGKMNYFMDNLKNYGIINQISLKRTSKGNIFEELQRLLLNFELSSEFAITIYYAHSMGILNDVIKIILMYNSLGGDKIYDIIEENDNKNRINLKKFIHTYSGKYNSELELLLDLANNFDKIMYKKNCKFNMTGYDDIKTVMDYSDSFNKAIKNTIIKELPSTYKNIKTISKTFFEGNKNIIVDAFAKNFGESPKYIEKIFLIYNTNRLITKNNNDSELTDFLNGKYINPKIFVEYIRNKIRFESMREKFDEILKNNIVQIKNEHNILLPFLYTFPYNIVKNVEGTSFYININCPEIESSYKFMSKKILGNMAVFALINNNLLYNYLFYLPARSNSKGLITFVSKISPNDIKSDKIISKFYQNDKIKMLYKLMTNFNNQTLIDYANKKTITIPIKNIQKKIYKEMLNELIEVKDKLNQTILSIIDDIYKN